MFRWLQLNDAQSIDAGLFSSLPANSIEPILSDDSIESCQNYMESVGDGTVEAVMLKILW